MLEIITSNIHANYWKKILAIIHFLVRPVFALHQTISKIDNVFLYLEFGLLIRVLSFETGLSLSL